jgi:hypothetical protein
MRRNGLIRSLDIWRAAFAFHAASDNNESWTPSPKACHKRDYDCMEVSQARVGVSDKCNRMLAYIDNDVDNNHMV